MFKNYLLSTIRGLSRDRLYASINTFGLALGLATGLLIFWWVTQELNYDRYEGHDQVFRVVTGWDQSPDQGIASTYPMMKDHVLSRFPEIVACTRLFDPVLRGGRTQLAIEDRIFTDARVFYADTSFFRVFPLKLVRGNLNHLFELPNAIVLSQHAAKVYFGEDDPLGRQILMDGKKELVVTGIMEDVPASTHFNFDMLISMESHPWIKQAEERLWSGVVFHTYVKVKPGTQVSQLAAKINDYLDHFPDDPDGYGKALKIELQPVADIHLKSHLRWELQPNGNIDYVYLFITIGLLVIVVACINYINLATARYTQRVKEVGIRKVLGANRRQLIFQFMSESLIVASAAFGISLVLFQAGLPWLELTTGQHTPGSDLFATRTLLMFSGISLAAGLVSGFFPAVILSGFKPMRLFKPGLESTPGGSSMRKALVVFQFTVSIILTVCTVVTYRQLQFVHQMNLGYDKEQVLVVPIRQDELLARYREFKSMLLVNSNIVGAAATSQLPTNITEGENIDISKSETRGVNYVSVDQDFFQVLNIDLKEGSSRIKAVEPARDINQFVLNESALKEIGWEKRDALGKTMSIRHGNMQPGQVLGIVSDFHFQSLHEVIGPLVIEFNPDLYQYLLVRIAPGKVTEAIDFVGKKWKAFAGNIPFDYSFLDQQYDQLYKSEKKIGSLFLLFATIASLIALLGLFGLASFSVEKRTKEIGIRKVLGASVSAIVGLLMTDFSWLLLIALAIALPVSYYYSNEWLQTFAYRTPLKLFVFAFAGLVNLVLAALTLLYHGLRASANNPVESLKDE